MMHAVQPQKERETMPRVEVDPGENIKIWEELVGRFSMFDDLPTIDVCSTCIKDFKKGCISPYSEYPGIIKKTNVDHPPYDKNLHECACCGEPLKNKRDY